MTYGPETSPPPYEAEAALEPPATAQPPEAEGTAAPTDSEPPPPLYSPEEAVEAAYNLRPYALKLTNGDPHLAADLLQELALRAWQHAGNILTLEPWLVVVLKRLARNALNHGTGYREMPVHNNAGPVAADNVAVLAVNRVLVADMLAVLTQDERELITLFYLGDWLHTEIAAHRRENPSTTRYRVHRVLRTLNLLFDPPE